MSIHTLVGLMLVATWTVAPGALQQPSPEELARRILRGKQVYAEQKCQACHSIDRVGNRRNPLDGVGDRLSAADIRKWIVSPREMNPRVTKRAYNNLPPGDLDALVAYAQSLRKK